MRVRQPDTSRSTYAVGLDLSLTASAVVAVPHDWSGKRDRIRTKMAGYSLPRTATAMERIRRCVVIADEVVAFLDHLHRVSTVFVEGYAFSRADQAHSLGECGGVVRSRLLVHGYDFEDVNISHARKLLLGKVPRDGKVKQRVADVFAAAGIPLDNFDKSDALAVANYGLSEMGMFAYAQGS
jgi:Holliday junction resolvasome RuvABC endonuclease subunit